MKKYIAFLDGREREIEIEPQNEGRYRVVIDGESHAVAVRSCGADALSLLVDQRSCDLAYAFQGDKLEIHFRRHDFEMEIMDERKLRSRRMRFQRDRSGPETVKSAMPGKIVKVHVAPGDRVEPHTALLIMEAMKMENEIFCRKGGTVKAVHVGAGQAVENDTLLVEIAPEPEAAS
jgi:biotin carboxyl carrier protein